MFIIFLRKFYVGYKFVILDLHIENKHQVTLYRGNDSLLTRFFAQYVRNFYILKFSNYGIMLHGMQGGSFATYFYPTTEIFD